MFNFMKKSTVLAHDSGGCEERDGDKDRRKKEKKERKEREKRERIAAGLEEPLRLEEVRRSLKLRGRRKEKEKLPSGITADYTASLFAHLEHDSNYSSYQVISTSGSNSNLSDENNHLSPGYATPHNNWNKKEAVLQSDSSETSLNSLNNPNNANSSPRKAQNLPPIPPRPPKRGILKGPRLSNTSSNSQESSVPNTDTVDFVNGQDTNVVARNTQQNEVISYGIPPSKSTSSSDDMQQIQNFTKKVIHSPVESQYKNYKNNSNPTITTQDVDEVPKTNGNCYLGVTSTSPSADSLTDTTTNSSFATPPFSTSPVGESQGFHRWSRTSTFDDVYLPLPALKPLQLPKPRTLTIQRQKAPRNDFGFSLRRAMVQERVFIGDLKELSVHEENGLTNGDSKCNGNVMIISKLTHKAVILAEPGSYPGASETGLLPGDRLIEVNGVNVEGKSREEVIDLIKGSQDSVTIKVQPIAELSELSRRRAADGVVVELSDSNVRGGTLSRSGSRRFNTTQGAFEQSLRCGDDVSPSGNKTLATLAKIHKHCTGKAHAHGCLDHKHNPLAKSDSNTSIQSRKSFRNDCIIEIKESKLDNSLPKGNGSFTKSFSNSTSSYEGHSDTDSESTPRIRPDPKTAAPGERLYSQNTKSSLLKTARMRYADDSVIASLHDEVDGEKWKHNFTRTPSRSSCRERKSGVVTIEEVKSESFNDDELNSDERKKAQQQNKTPLYRKVSTGNAPTNGSKPSNGTKPPWRGGSKNGRATEPFVRSPSLRGSIKKKKSDGVPWRRLYEFSLWRRCGVSFASAGAESERALLRPWSEMSAEESPPPITAKSEEQLACEKEWLQAGHMWLAHRGGFTAVVRDGDADGGRAKVRVLQTGETLVVDEDDLEKANPPQLERCEDIASLRCLNECGALNVLRSRYAAGLPHARAGHALLVLGPPRRTTPIYTEKVAAMFRGCRADDMPPHVFAAAQSAHRCMLASRRDRAIVFLGRSGSGKTSAMRHCVWYLASAYPAQGSKLTPERLNAAFDVLHAFGSSRTGSNPHASRFVSLTSLDFDGGGALVSASVQTLLPDFRPGQSPLRALHTLFHGSDGRLRRDLLLDQAPVNAPNPFISCSDKAEAPAEFSALKEALQALSVTEPEQAVVWKILAAICHLGWSGVTKANAGSSLKYQFGSSGCASRAARLLGVGVDELSRAVFAPPAPASPQTNAALRTPSPSGEREVPGSEALDAFVTGLYNETFNIIAALVNRSLSTSARTSASILLLDTPGADNPMCAGQQSGAPLSKLLSNYLQERLQAVFHEATLVAPRERYAQEGITLDDGSEEDWVCETVNPGPMVELLDKSPQNSIVRSSQADLRDCDRRGLLWLLDEESMYPGSSDDSFLERALTHYGPPHHTHYLIKKAPHARQFVLQHLQGTNPVLYDVTGWVKASRENPVTKKAHTLLQESQNEDIGRLSSWSRGACGVGAWSAAVGDASTLRRASSIRRTLTSGTAGMKRRSTALQAKFVADGVVDTLRRCGSGGVHFVCCLLAGQQADATDDVNVPLLRSQFRGFQLLDAARLYKQGFPEHMPLSEFARRYRLLATSESESTDNSQQTATLSERQIVDDMLLALDLDVTSYRLGLTQIMFRGGVVGGLDARRDAALARVLVRLQARARGLLARRRAERLRTQHTAARCVQRNVRAFLAVRDWPWWRLLVRVTPLLAVHRTEHRLKQAQDELETLRAKLEKVEGERTHYKNETEKLETKLSEVGGELAEERAAAALATERADAEAAERLRVERDNRDLVANNQRLQQASERLELELLHWRSAENGVEPSDSEGSEAESGVGSDKYKRRYEQAHRELQLLRAQLRRQHEDDLEQLVTVKKQLEKKVQDAYEEVEEQRAVAASWKRKLQKLTNDMADLRSLLDEQTCRNNLLEKRQRKFDAELQSAQEELKRERATRERHARERDQALADKYALEQSLSEARLEVELKEERLAAAARELEERGGGGDELAALRRARADLERRARDQEEELDDLAGQIQLLESSKLRLEMLLEQQRKEARLEAAARDDEMEETRANAAKKLKILESQLESEHAERSLLLRERHELERRLAALEEAARADTQEQAQLVQRLKRDLKRYRALLRDAQTMLEQKEKEGGAKAQIRQLKNQVEDLELAVRAASKARATAEAEAAEAAAALEEATRARTEAAERALAASRDAATARAALDDAEEEAAELLKKYRSSTSALCAAQAEAREAVARADAAAEEARLARERLAELAQRLAHAEAGHSHTHSEAERRLEMRNKELESSLELEATSRARLEGQLARLRDAHDALANELAVARARDAHAADDLRKLQRSIRELKEENATLTTKLSEAGRARTAAEAAASAAASEAAAARDEARLAARRAQALQEAIAGDLSSNNERDSDSDNDSYSSDESIGTFLANHKLSPSAPSRNSVQFDSQKSHSPEGRRSGSSAGSASKPASPSKESFA